jgi:hypothetical protein
MICSTCGSRRGCACTATVDGDVLDLDGVGSGSDPYITTALQAALAACIEPYMNALDFELDTVDGNLRWVVPAGVPAGWIYVADGAGGAAWTAP